ncbi:MAG TPA: DUF58 domain-containing protein [Acidimicrobiales bacterium]
MSAHPPPVTPTRAGWLLLGGSTVSLATGRVFGLLELIVVGIGGGLLVMATMVLTRGARDLEVHRRMGAGLGPVGANIPVEIEIVNGGRRRTPAALVRNQTGNGEFRALVAPLGPGEVAWRRYGFELRRRGLVTLDPVMIETADPFGLVTAARAATDSTRIIVVPRIVAIRPLPRAASPVAGRAPDAPGRPVVAGHGEFHSLREWREGDELRSIHWRSSLRRGALLVREDEAPHDGMAAVVIDTRETDWDPAGFEEGMEAAASIVAASTKVGHKIRLVTTDGADSGYGVGTPHLDRVLSMLAEARPGRGDRAAAAQRAVAGAGSVAVVAGQPRGGSARLAGLLAADRAVILVSASRRGAPHANPSTRVPVVPTGPALAPAWARAVAAVERNAP